MGTQMTKFTDFFVGVVETNGTVGADGGYLLDGAVGVDGASFHWNHVCCRHTLRFSSLDWLGKP